MEQTEQIAEKRTEEMTFLEYWESKKLAKKSVYHKFRLDIQTGTGIDMNMFFYRFRLKRFKPVEQIAIKNFITSYERNLNISVETLFPND